MRIYFAAMMQNNYCKGSTTYLRLTEHEQSIVDSIEHKLDSYHYIGTTAMVDRIRKDGTRIFLDSGAFSAYTKGIEVNIDQYCRYIYDNYDIFDAVDGQPLVSVLDAIGDADGTYRNQKYMESVGIRPLPCFHYGEPEYVLEHYISEYDFITIGGMVPITSSQLKIWLDRIWGKYLTHPDGTPKLKVHGFGLTSVPLMARYPWFSVDSSSWVQVGGLGAIFFADYGMLHISEHSPNLKEDGKHFDSLTEPEKERLTQYIEEKGFDVERLRKEHLSRKVFNMMEYLSLAGAENKRFVLHQPVLF